MFCNVPPAPHEDLLFTAVLQWVQSMAHTMLATVWLALGRGPCRPGGRLNKKDGLTRYGDSHVKDKTS